MWDSNAQAKLVSKYFIDPQLDNKMDVAEREGKYQNSLSRHLSEDIRAISKIFERVNIKNEASTHYKELILKLEESKKNYERLYEDLKNIQIEREKTEVKLNKLYSEKNQYSKSLETLESKKRIEEEEIFEALFKKVTPKYYDYLISLKSSGDCPLCNNELPKVLFEKITSDDTHCMMCNSSIKKPQLESTKLLKIKSELNDLMNLIRIIEKDIFLESDKLKKFDTKYRDTELRLNTIQSNIRQTEFAIQKQSNKEKNNINSEFHILNTRIKELEIEKEKAINASRKAYAAAQEIAKKIDEERLETRERLSEIFSKFGTSFLGVPCELVYEDPKDGEGKRYLPRINGKDREDEEELSESQRFFIDQTFRMSLLSFFNRTPSFFMCETPDSSLDISYEKNAAKIFLEYVKQPNELIISSNLNNSVFLEYLIEESKPKAISYINLLKIGKRSHIQSNSDELLQASEKIEKIINGKAH